MHAFIRRLSSRPWPIGVAILALAALACGGLGGVEIPAPLEATQPALDAQIDASTPVLTSPPPTAVPLPDIGERPPGPSTELVAPRLEVVNNSGVQLCALYVSPVTTNTWTNDVLTDPLIVGGALELTVYPPEDHDLRADDCTGQPVEQQFGVPLGEAAIRWSIGEDALQFLGRTVPYDTPSTLPKPYEVAYREADCPFPVPASTRIACGYLDVPENRVDPASQNTISLAVAVVSALGSPYQPDPIIHLVGGPGQSALDLLALNPENYAYDSWLNHRDQVFIDQRGAGYSLPTLNCPELEDPLLTDQAAATRQCHDRLLASGVDLSAYNSRENAADIADLIQALGYPQANLYGASYGTRLALTVLRDHPDRVRSVVLDSVFPPNVITPLEEPLASYHALRRVFDACAADPACAAAYPDLETTLAELVSVYNQQPALAEVEDFATGQTIQEDLTGDAILETLANALYSGRLAAAYIPRAITDLVAGDITAYEAVRKAEYDYFGRSALYAYRQEGADYTDSEGMYNSVTCGEEYAFDYDFEALDYVRAQVPAALVPGLFTTVDSTFTACRIWDVSPASINEERPVVSDVPALLIGGGFDPSTPSDWAVLAARTLPNGYLYLFDYEGHALTSTNECSWDIVADFIDDPTMPPASAACIAEQPPPGWLLPGDPVTLPQREE